MGARWPFNCSSPSRHHLRALHLSRLSVTQTDRQTHTLALYWWKALWNANLHQRSLLRLFLQSPAPHLQCLRCLWWHGISCTARHQKLLSPALRSFFRGPLCCTGRRRAEKNERKVGKEARREKWTTAHLGVRWRQSGRQRKKERRGKEGEWQGKGHRETKRDMESRQIRREIRAGSMTERVEDQKGCFHLYFYLIQKCAHIKKCQLRERTAQTARKAVLTAQPT